MIDLGSFTGGIFSTFVGISLVGRAVIGRGKLFALDSAASCAGLGCFGSRIDPRMSERFALGRAAGCADFCRNNCISYTLVTLFKDTKRARTKILALS